MHEIHELRQSLERIEKLLMVVLRLEATEMQEIDDLQVQAQKTLDAETAAINLLNSLAALLTQNAEDPARIRAIATSLGGSSDALAAAILADTPQGGDTKPQT